MGATDVLSIVLYILGSLLLLVLIVLCIKLVFTVDKTNRLLDDIQGKSKSLDGLFKGIDKFTDGMNRVSTTVVSSLLGLIGGMKKRKTKEELDDDFDLELEEDEDE